MNILLSYFYLFFHILFEVAVSLIVISLLPAGSKRRYLMIILLALALFYGLRPWIENLYY